MSDETTRDAGELEERLNSFGVAASYANRFYLAVVDENIRVAFGELQPAPSGTPRFHSAAVMTKANAIELAQLLLRFAVPASPEGGGDNDA